MFIYLYEKTNVGLSTYLVASTTIILWVTGMTTCECGEVTPIPCSQEFEDITRPGVRKRSKMEDSSVLYGETIPPSLQSPIQFEMATKKFIHRLYILLGTANPSAILQTISFGEEHDITVILEDEKLGSI